MWIWHDLWIPRHFTCRTSSRRGPCRLHWVSELLNAEGSDWDYNKIVPVFNNADAESIMKIKLSERKIGGRAGLAHGKVRSVFC